MVDSILVFLLSAVVIVLAVTVHEAAHGLIAARLGDPTAKLLGRLTLNPLKHIDPIGTILLPIGMLAATSFLSSMFPSLITGPFLFGWAKPVPVNPNNLAFGRKGMSLVALAGPFSNLLMAMLCLMILNETSQQSMLHDVMITGLLINVSLMIINLVPILPLDGGRILYGLLPQDLARPYGSTERYGMFIIIILLMFGVIQSIVHWGLFTFLRLVS